MLYYTTGERAHKNKKNWSWVLSHEEGGERDTRQGMVAHRAGPMAVLSLTEAVMKHSSDSVRAARCHRAMGQSVFSVRSVYVFVWALYGGFHVVLGVCIRLGVFCVVF